MVVERNKNGTPAGLETVHETELFKGGENSLVMFQTYTHDFQCIFNLKKYPFDTQTCSIVMAMGSLDEASVWLYPGHLHMNQSVDMAIFQIMDWKLHSETYDNGRTTLRMTMVLKRKIISELMTTYFPTLLLTAITFLLRGSLEREPNHHAGDDHHLHQQDGGLAPHLCCQDD